MQTSVSEITLLTILISTLLLLLFGGIIIYYLFLYQKKRYRHSREISELREAFNQTLLQSKLEIQEETLDHISKELHANFSHLVSLININLSAILPNSNDEMKESIVETKSLAKQLLSELKALSAGLNTDHIMHIGFVSALENELGRLNKTKKFRVTFTRTGDGFYLRPEHQIILFRLCQEVLNNIVKYSHAESVTAILLQTEQSFSLEITDDGQGFDVAEAQKAAAKKESTGLLNMQKRARLIDAAIKIESAIGSGTKVRITIAKTENHTFWNEIRN
jgi:signal transduction histidine kinase